jgi:hypothetical protein
MASEGRKIRVILPDEPPPISPAAARVLLRILARASAGDQERQAGQ